MNRLFLVVQGYSQMANFTLITHLIHIKYEYVSTEKTEVVIFGLKLSSQINLSCFVILYVASSLVVILIASLLTNTSPLLVNVAINY